MNLVRGLAQQFTENRTAAISFSYFLFIFFLSVGVIASSCKISEWTYSA